MQIMLCLIFLDLCGFVFQTPSSSKCTVDMSEICSREKNYMDMKFASTGFQ